MRKIIDVTQIIFGYWLIYSILKLTVYFLNFTSSFIIFIFITFLILFKITPHPTNHKNPLTFGLYFRFSQ